MLHQAKTKEQLLRWLDRALAAVDARARAAAALRRLEGECAVLALGKAAGSMAAGAEVALGDRIRSALAVSPYRSDSPGARWRLIEGAHPLPDERSLHAGEAVRDWLQALPAGLPLIVLLSGGASASLELPVDGMTLEKLRELNRWLLGSGLDIAAMNAVRARFSQLKRGGLARLAGRRRIHVLATSDVPGDRVEDIGSGPCWPEAPRWPQGLPAWLNDWHETLPLPEAMTPPAEISHAIIARNSDALEAVVDAVEEDGVALADCARLEGDAVAAAKRIVADIDAGPAGVHLWGGETTVTLPENPGRGGRCQHLALAAAIALEGREDVALLAFGTDGIDGSTEDAGAVIDGRTLDAIRDEGLDALHCLERADSNTALQAAGALVHTGATGTNVMDVVIGWKFH